MRRIIIIVILLLIVSAAAIAQPAWQRIDSVTYRLYMDKDWKNLLKETRKSLGGGIDFYYLRVRAGVAAYEMKNYRLAARHLGKAHSWNNTDEFANYWYYYALLNGNRIDESRLISSGFSNDYLNRMQIKPESAINTILAETQLSINADYNNLLSENITGDYSYMAYRNVLKQQFYKGIGIDHKVSDRLFLFHGISHLGVQRMQMFGRAFSPRIDYQYKSSTSQFQYYLQGRYILSGGWTASAAVTMLWGNAESNYITFTNSGVPLLNNFSYKIGDRFLNASLAKELIWLRPKLLVAYGSVNGYRQLQATGQVVIYPMGNPDIYLTSDLSLHNDESTEDTKTVFNQKIGLKTGPLWLIAESATGPMRNFAASDGYVIYNMAETVKNLYGLAVYIPLMKYRFDVTARYQMVKKQGTTFDYLNPSEIQEQNYTFIDNNFLISLRWHL